MSLSLNRWKLVWGYSIDMNAYSEIMDTSVLSEIFSTYSEDSLKDWGLPGFQTTSVQVSHLKRVFVMERVFTASMLNVHAVFISPKKEIAARLATDFPLMVGDKLIIRYAVTAHEGGGDGHVRIRTPGGTYLRVNIYATAV